MLLVILFHTKPLQAALLMQPEKLALAPRKTSPRAVRKGRMFLRHPLIFLLALIEPETEGQAPVM
jgi:hypothetical protein